MSVFISIRTGLLASALAFTPVGAWAQVLPAGSMNSTYTIPGGGLTSALNQFAEASGVQISYQATLAEGLSSQGVSGRMSPGEALTALLRGTGLSWRFVDVRTVTIERAQRGAMALDPVYVTAAYSGVAASSDDESESDEQSAGRASSSIIVNAQRTQNDAEAATGPLGAKAVLDTPYSISVTSKDLIQTVAAGDMDQIFKMNPVVQASAPTTHNGVPFAAIRGFHSDAGVMDGLRLSSASTGLAMEEIERIEIMNGLSGFMYGVGNPGGVANYVLKRPTYERTADLAVGNYGNQQWFVHADLGNRIDSDGMFAYRLNLSHQNGETSKENQNVRRTLISGALDWNVTPDLQFQVEAAHTYYRVDGRDARVYAYANSSYGALGYWIDPLKNDKSYTPPWSFLEIKTDRIGGNVKWNLNETFSLRSAYIYKRDVSEAINVYPIYFADSGYVIGWPSRAAPAANIAQGAYSYMDASFDTGGIKHKLTAGVSIDRLRVRQHVTAYAYASNSPAYSDPNDLMSWAKPDSLAEQDWGARYTASTSRNLNIILGDDITFSDTLSALIGVNRTNMVTKSYTVTGDVTGYDKTVVTPTASLIFKPTANVTTYAIYMEGLESGSVTPNEPSYAEPGKILDPFVSKQYEVGAKFAPRDGLLITAALFRIEKANSYEDVTSSGQLTITQDGLQIHQGLELTLSGKVTDRLTLIAGGTLMDAKVSKADNPALEGKKPTDVSNRLAKIFAQYEIPGVSCLSLSGGAFYAGPTYKDAVNLQKIDGYLVFDLGAHLKTTIAYHPVSFNLNVANLTDKSYWASMYVIGLPRNIAFSVRTSF